MNRERLSQMVAMLRGLSPSRFDISDWQCGATACAVGHACLSPYFQAQGLRLRKDYDGVTPIYDQHDGWDAVERFFDIDAGTAEHFFYRSEYPGGGETTTADEVADRIELFLSESEATA